MINYTKKVLKCQGKSDVGATSVTFHLPPPNPLARGQGEARKESSQ